MSAPFAKIIAVDGDQTLYFLEASEEVEDQAIMHQIVYMDGLRIDAKVGPMSWEKADALLAKIDEEHTRTVRQAVAEIIGAKP